MLFDSDIHDDALYVHEFLTHEACLQYCAIEEDKESCKSEQNRFNLL
jgi:hypothetical protein